MQDADVSSAHWVVLLRQEFVFEYILGVKSGAGVVPKEPHASRGQERRQCRGRIRWTWLLNEPPDLSGEMAVGAMLLTSGYRPGVSERHIIAENTAEVLIETTKLCKLPDDKSPAVESRKDCDGLSGSRDHDLAQSGVHDP